MRIGIVSSDKRYIKINELLLKTGYDSFISAYNGVVECDCLILPIREELSDEELKILLEGISIKTVVLCGSEERVKRYFGGRVLAYGQDKGTLEKNARLTAEAAISYIHGLTKSSLYQKKVFVSGYGRIGKELCRLLKCFGASVYAFARREDVVREIEANGIIPSSLEDSVGCDIIFNTVPARIFSSELTAKIPDHVFLVELASAPFGFEDDSRVNYASGLPGRVLEQSGAEVIFEAIVSLLTFGIGDNV